MTSGQILRCLIYGVQFNLKGAIHALGAFAARGDGRQVALQIGGQSPTRESCTLAIAHVIDDCCEGCGAYDGHAVGCQFRGTV